MFEKPSALCSSSSITSIAAKLEHCLQECDSKDCTVMMRLEVGEMLKNYENNEENSVAVITLIITTILRIEPI